MGFFLPINTVIAAGEDLSEIQFKVQQEQLADSDLNIVTHFAMQLPHIVEEHELDTLREEFTDYQLADPEDLPTEEKLDEYWGKIAQMTSGFQIRCPTLFRLMKALPAVRTFSMVRKGDTESRADLGKYTSCCHESTISDKVLRDCK
ncbi:UNVERIFIED_CONTAM: hypothetical protein FKN15_042016 [Acipenser sinensis]